MSLSLCAVFEQRRRRELLELEESFAREYGQDLLLDSPPPHAHRHSPRLQQHEEEEEDEEEEEEGTQPNDRASTPHSRAPTTRDDSPARSPPQQEEEEDEDEELVLEALKSYDATPAIRTASPHSEGSKGPETDEEEEVEEEGRCYLRSSLDSVGSTYVRDCGVQTLTPRDGNEEEEEAFEVKERDKAARRQAKPRVSSRQSQEEAGEGEEGRGGSDDDLLDLMYDPYMNCYYDPHANKYYQLK